VLAVVTYKRSLADVIVPLSAGTLNLKYRR
jgi:hypothetical protein